MSFETIKSHLVFTKPLNANSLVVDGGAHKGWFSTEMAGRFGCTCIAFEPAPDLFKALPAASGVSYHHAALCGSDGPVSIAAEVSAVGPMGTALSRLASSTPKEDVLVPGLSFPALVESIGNRPIDLLKLDIEGAEIEFLDSAPDSALEQIGQITMEFHEHCGITPRSEVERVCQRLQKLGFYRIWSSWRVDTHDTLFVHNRLLSRWQYLLQMYPARYSRGMTRLLKRKLFGSPVD